MPNVPMTAANELPRAPQNTEFANHDAALRQVAILVVDDEPGMRNFLVRTLSPLCRRIEEAASVEAASKLLDAQHFDLVILDNVMPGQSGLDWLAEQRRVGFFSEAILMTAYADLDTAIHALRVGASDLVLKPFRSNQILNAVRRSIDQRFLQRENSLLKYELSFDSKAARGRLLGRSPRIEAVRNALKKVARLPTPVLLTGESGTGKEIAARTLHTMSDRADKPFVPINCANISADGVASELFGDIGQGAGRKDGLLLLASGGTLFLDEIADLPLSVQATLLRVIEDNRIRPVGSDREVPLNLRFVCATNADLGKAVAEGRFRKDLYHRINVMPLHMPPLRDRVGDIADLAELFMDGLSRELGVARLPLTEAVALKLARYDWPGNVRELRNLIERSLILGEVPPEFASDEDTVNEEPVESLFAMERRHIMTILEASGGNRAEAARRLGVSRKTIDRKCAMWNV
jgi:DNA-binding NtrC family response regulator